MTDTIQQRFVKRDQVKDLIYNTHGKPFRVSLIKKDGSLREMKAQTEVEIGLKGGKSTLEDHPEYYVVYDTEKEAYRAVNMDTVIELIIDDVVYVVLDDDGDS